MSGAPPPASEIRPVLADRELAEFREQGFTSIDRITSDEELEWLREVYGELFDAKRGGVTGGYFDLARPYDAAGDDLLPQVLFPERAFPELRDTMCYRNGRRLAAQLLDVAVDDVDGWGHMIDKPPRRGHETPWHQDEAYWDPSLTYHAVGVWMPLDDVDLDNGCMMFVPGSHRAAVQAHRHITDDPRVHGLQFVDDVDTTSAVAVALRAGGATFHHHRTFHATGPNRSGRRRRAYANEFQTPPVPASVPAVRPWVDAGREAMEKREVFAEGGRTGGAA